MKDTPKVPDYLPEIKVDIPSPIPLHADATEEDAIKADLPLANAALGAVHLCWGEVKSVAEVERLIKMTADATKHRRACLGLNYGAGTKVESASRVVLPLD